MEFNGSMFRICGAGASGTGTSWPELEPEPKCFPGAGAGAIKFFADPPPPTLDDTHREGVHRFD